MLAGLLALAILIAAMFPKTPTGRLLHFYLVELPLQLAKRIERKHVILLAILLCCGQGLALIGSAELAMAYALDMSLYYDALLTASAAAAAARLRNGWSALVASSGFGRRPSSRPRSPRRAKSDAPRREQAIANDDEPGTAAA